MAASGTVRDASFATGFLRVIARTPDICVNLLGHCRAKAQSNAPLGAVDGDVAVVFRNRHSPGNTLLIVEREGSAPGNERNILKWFEAIRAGNAISICQFGKAIGPFEYAGLELLLAFARPQAAQNKDGWGQSDFEKTVGFCKILAELVNHECERTSLLFKVRVEKCSEAIADDCWEKCGEHFGQLVMSWRQQ